MEKKRRERLSRHTWAVRLRERIGSALKSSELEYYAHLSKVLQRLGYLLESRIRSEAFQSGGMDYTLSKVLSFIRFAQEYPRGPLVLLPFFAKAH